MGENKWISAQEYEDKAWDALDRGDKAEAMKLMMRGAYMSIGRIRADRMKEYAHGIEFGFINVSSDRFSKRHDPVKE